MVVFRDEQLALQQWLTGWQLYASDPPGALREWLDGEYLPYGIHGIWGHQPGVDAWQLQLMLAEVDGAEWFSRHSSLRGPREDMIAVYNGLPCIHIEVQLMFKARGRRPKDELDFRAAVPLMNAESKRWLRDSLRLLHPDGYPWLETL